MAPDPGGNEMTAEEYIVSRVQDLEGKNRLLEKRVNDLVAENDKLADTIGEIADIINPHLSQDGEFVMYDSVWSGGGEKQFNRICEIFGLKEQE